MDLTRDLDSYGLLLGNPHLYYYTGPSCCYTIPVLQKPTGSTALLFFLDSERQFYSKPYLSDIHLSVSYRSNSNNLARKTLRTAYLAGIDFTSYATSTAPHPFCVRSETLSPRLSTVPSTHTAQSINHSFHFIWWLLYDLWHLGTLHSRLLIPFMYVLDSPSLPLAITSSTTFLLYQTFLSSSTDDHRLVVNNPDLQ